MTAMLKKILYAVLDPSESIAGAEAIYLPLSKFLPQNGITELKEIAQFCAQCAHESGGFRRLSENLNYSAIALVKNWKKFALPDGAPNDLAKKIERNPELVGNHVYGNRMGNGAPETGDGFKYRGRGIIQLTGKNNYIAAQNDLGIKCVEHPDMLTGIECAARVAVWFWSKNKCGQAKTFLGQSRIINLGNEHSEKMPNGMKDREARLARALSVIEG